MREVERPSLKRKINERLISSMATKTTKKKDTKDMYRYKLLVRTLNELEKGMYTDVDIHWCCDTIGWLWKWKKITREEMNVLCERATAILER